MPFRSPNHRILKRRVMLAGALATASIFSVIQMAHAQAAVNAVHLDAAALPVVASSGDATAKVTNCDGGSCSSFAGNQVGDFVTYELNVPQARAYDLSLDVKKYDTRGTYQLAIKGAANATYDGGLRDHGAPIDNYAPSQSFQTVSLGTVSFGTAGAKQFRFTAVGKNVDSRSYQLVLAAIILTPVGASSTTAPASPAKSVEPNASNTGVPAGTSLTVHNGDLVITQPGATYDSLDVHGFVKVEAANVTITRSVIRGGHASTNTGLVNTMSPNAKNFTIKDSTLLPSYPSVWINGVFGHDYTAVRVNTYNVVDGFDVFNPAKTAAGGYVNGSANVNIESSYVHDLAYFSPDPNHPDNRTHNDGVQIQGNSNIQIVGNTIMATASTTAGTGSVKGTPADDSYFPSVTGQDIGITPNVGPVTDVVIDSNWLDYGAQSITIIAATSGPTTSAILTNNRFGTAQPLLNKAGVVARRAVLIQSNLSVPALPSVTGADRSSGNVDNDGTPVVIYRLPSA